MTILPRFITFEGIDGAGKSSHIPWLADALTHCGQEVRVTREPGGTPLGEKLRASLLSDPMEAETELLMMFASRIEHVRQVIEPAHALGQIVLCDRYTDSSYAFQGGGRRNISYDRILELENWSGIPTPGLTFLFDLPVEVAQARIAKERQLDRFEQEEMDFHQRVRDAYLHRVKLDPVRFVVLDATKSIEEIREDIIAAIEFKTKLTQLLETLPKPKQMKP